MYKFLADKYITQLEQPSLPNQFGFVQFSPLTKFRVCYQSCFDSLDEIKKAIATELKGIPGSHLNRAEKAEKLL